MLSFDSQGFTVGDDGDVNTNLKNYVGWVWKAGGTPTVDNSAANDAQPTAGSAKIDGSNKVGAFSGSPSIAIKRLSANTTAGFSMVTWTGTGAAGTIPHGLGKTPQAYIVKCISNDSTNWRVYHSGIASDAETQLSMRPGLVVKESFDSTSNRRILLVRWSFKTLQNKSKVVELWIYEEELEIVSEGGEKHEGITEE